MTVSYSTRRFEHSLCGLCSCFVFENAMMSETTDASLKGGASDGSPHPNEACTGQTASYVSVSKNPIRVVGA